MNTLELKVCRIRQTEVPTKTKDGSVGFDVYLPMDLTKVDMRNAFKMTFDIEAGRGPVQWPIYDLNTGYLKSLFIAPSESVVIPTGLKVNVPKGYVLKVENRSSISTKAHLLVGAGIIDPGYEGEVLVNLHNTSNTVGSYLNAGDRICQLILYPVAPVDFVSEVPTVVELFKDVERTENSRGEGGFGSTGK